MRTNKPYLLILVAFALCLTACTPLVGTSEYVISGTVVNVEGKPIEDVVIKLSGSSSRVISDLDASGAWGATTRGRTTVIPQHNNYTFEPTQVLVTGTRNDLHFTARTRHPGLPVHYKHLLLVYTEVDAKVIREDGREWHYKASMPENLQQLGIDAFKNLPNLIEESTGGNVTASTEVIFVDHPLTSISSYYHRGNEHEPGDTWQNMVAIANVQDDLEYYAPLGKYDAVIVLWHNTNADDSFYSNWGMGGSRFHNGTTTFASVISGRESLWLNSGQAKGEIFLHEWLHGITNFFMGHGYRNFPINDLHGYRLNYYDYQKSPPNGWMAWYSDYMQGKVWDDKSKVSTGITEEMWAIGTPRSFVNDAEVAAQSMFDVVRPMP